MRELSEYPSNWRAKSSLSDYLKYHGKLAIAEIDTRALTRHIREKGAMRCGISTRDLIALSLMTGFQEDIQEKILGASAHVLVYPTGSRGIIDINNTMKIVRSDPEVVSAAPVVYGKVLAYTAAGANGILLKGIDQFYQSLS